MNSNHIYTLMLQKTNENIDIKDWMQISNYSHVQTLVSVLASTNTLAPLDHMKSIICNYSKIIHSSFYVVRQDEEDS